MIPVVFPEQWDESLYLAGNVPSAPKLGPKDIEAAFQRLIESREAYERYKFAFFIDGLDEFEGEDDVIIRNLFRWIATGGKELKICVSSRELNTFVGRKNGFGNCPNIRLEDLTGADIEHFVHDTLVNNDYFPKLSSAEERSIFVDQIVKKSDGPTVCFFGSLSS